MESEKCKESKYSIFEWSIENFSCWSRKIHSNVIPSPKSCNFFALSLELYPRGLSGDDEHLEVVIYGGGICTHFGELSYICPDGSILCRQKVDSEEKIIHKLPPGPKFDTVVAQIKKKEALHEDRLIVRYLRRNDKNCTEYMHTVLSVFKVSFKMSRGTFDDLDAENENLFWIDCPEDDEEKGRGRIQLSASKDKTNSSKMVIQLQLLHFKKNVLVLTHMSAMYNDDELVKTEEDEHLFLDGNKTWTFSITLTREEMKDQAEILTSLFISLKIIPSMNYRHSLGLLQFPERKVDILPSNSFMPHITSISAKKSLKSATSATSNQKDDPVTILVKQLMCLYLDTSVFHLKCENISFPVHKNILSARSPVFKTMLSCDMEEVGSRAVHITDMDPSTLGLFLTYLYTSAVEDLQGESALKLYYAADKYQVPSLKKECVNFLCDKVSISNVSDILSLANKQQDDRLIAVVHEFILNNYNDVLSSEEWKSFMRREPLLAVETLTNFAEKKYVRKCDVYEN